LAHDRVPARGRAKAPTGPQVNDLPLLDRIVLADGGRAKRQFFFAAVKELVITSATSMPSRAARRSSNRAA
jgi:hypothetical protein